MATAYGWTKRDVLALSYPEIQAFLNMLAEDNRKQKAAYAKNRGRTRR